MYTQFTKIWFLHDITQKLQEIGEFSKVIIFLIKLTLQNSDPDI